MKKQLFFAITMAVLLGTTGCGTPRGHLVGVYRKAPVEVYPYGMLLIPRGSFNMGANDQSTVWALQPSQRQVSIDAFYMDQTENYQCKISSVCRMGKRFYCKNETTQRNGTGR